MRAILWFAASVALCSAASTAQASVYQKAIFLNCGAANTCRWTGVAVAAGKTLTISTISCTAAFSSPATASTGAGVVGTSNMMDGFQIFAFTVITQSVASAPTQNVPYTFVSGKVPIVSFQTNTSVTGAAWCTLRGTLTP